MNFRPRKGAVRRLECKACGECIVERWHGSGPADFTVSTDEGHSYDPGCPMHPAGPYRGHHDFVKSVRWVDLAPGAVLADSRARVLSVEDAAGGGAWVTVCFECHDGTRGAVDRLKSDLVVVLDPGGV